jgi:hypothetical protein
MHSTQRGKGFAKNVNNLVSAVLVILSVALQWYSHAGGLLKTPDSCNYLSAAESFQKSYTLLSPDGTHYDQWPPLFPIILIALGNYWDWIQLALGAWCAVLLIIETRKLIADPIISLVCQASIVLGVHLLLIGVFLWSELLFLLLLIYFIKAIGKDQFIVAVILGFFLCLQRNAGLYFVAAAALWLWDIKRSTILFLFSTSGFWIWNILNSKLEQEYLVWTFDNFHLMASSLGRAYTPILPGIIFIILSASAIFVLRTEIKNNPTVRLWIFSIVAYLGGLTVLFKLHGYDDDRYAAIILPYFSILVFRVLEIIVSKQTSTVRILLMVVMVCWLAYPLTRTVKNAIQWHKVSFTSYFCAIQF